MTRQVEQARQNILARKLATLKRTYHEGGLQQIRKLVLHKLFDYEYPMLGRLVELGGNKVTIDGCVYDTSDPQISRKFKWRMWAQFYEWEIRELIKKSLDPSLPLVELGGSIGVVSCISNQLLVHPEQHVVVEANPFLVPVLRRARERNNAKFTILQNALGYGNGAMLEFYRDPESFVSGTLVSQATSVVQVEAISLERILDRFQFPQVCVICDIEGTEIELIEREWETLKTRVKVLIVEWHEFLVGRAKVLQCRVCLEKAGFEQVQKAGIVSAWVNRNG